MQLQNQFAFDIYELAIYTDLNVNVDHLTKCYDGVG